METRSVRNNRSFGTPIQVQIMINTNKTIQSLSSIYIGYIWCIGTWLNQGQSCIMHREGNAYSSGAQYFNPKSCIHFKMVMDMLPSRTRTFLIRVQSLLYKQLFTFRHLLKATLKSLVKYKCSDFCRKSIIYRFENWKLARDYKTPTNA